MTFFLAATTRIVLSYVGQVTCIFARIVLSYVGMEGSSSC